MNTVLKFHEETHVVLAVVGNYLRGKKHDLEKGKLPLMFANRHYAKQAHVSSCMDVFAA